MYISVSIHNQTAFNQSSSSHARKHTHITITLRSCACSASNIQTSTPTPRPPTTTQPQLFCAEHPVAATPQQPQPLTSPATTGPNTRSPSGVVVKHAANCLMNTPTAKPNTTRLAVNTTTGTVLRRTPAAATPNHEIQTTISPRTIRQNSRYADGRLSAHAVNCSAHNT